MKEEVLVTDRLVLRRLSGEDAAFMLELLNEPSFIQNIGDRGIRTIDDAVSYIARGPQASYARLGFGLYLVELKESATPIGICGLLKRDELEDVDIGFAFLPAYWSKGYAIEAARAVAEYGRGVIGLEKLVAITLPTNQGSIRVLQKLGFTFEKTVRLGDGEQLQLFRAPEPRYSGS